MTVDRADPVATQTAELRAIETERNADVARKLVDTAERVRDDLIPVVKGLAASPSHAELATWRRRLAAAAESLTARRSAGTEVNLASGSLTGAVVTLRRSVEATATALDSTPQDRPELRALARDLRADALVAWSVAATQLDVAGIEAGLGHVHVFMPAQGLPGELTADH